MEKYMKQEVISQKLNKTTPLSHTNAAGSADDFHALRNALSKRIQDNCFKTKSTFDFVTDETFSSSLLNHLLQTLSTLNRGITRKKAIITRLCKLQRVNDALHVSVGRERERLEANVTERMRGRDKAPRIGDSAGATCPHEYQCRFRGGATIFRHSCRHTSIESMKIEER
ncbi:hypothetical protein AHAS_Ahas19G0030500 [Arachis hypogaea]